MSVNSGFYFDATTRDAGLHTSFRTTEKHRSSRGQFSPLGDSNTKLSDDVNAALYYTNHDTYISVLKSPIYCRHFILRNIKHWEITNTVRT